MELSGGAYDESKCLSASIVGGKRKKINSGAKMN